LGVWLLIVLRLTTLALYRTYLQSRLKPRCARPEQGAQLIGLSGLDEDARSRRERKDPDQNGQQMEDSGRAGGGAQRHSMHATVSQLGNP